jgi:hypothetical protein
MTHVRYEDLTAVVMKSYNLLGYNAVQSVESQSTFRRRHVPQKRRLTFNGMHGIISQKLELFINYLSLEDSDSTRCAEHCHFQINGFRPIKSDLVGSGKYCKIFNTFFA